MQIDFKNKTIFVSGCTNGIGKEILFHFYKLGANCIGLSRNEKELKKIQKQLTNDRFVFICYDLRNPYDLHTSLSNTVIGKSWEPVSVLINNVGGPDIGSINVFNRDSATEEFNKYFINFNELIHYFLPHLKKNKSSKIINILGTSVNKPFPFIPMGAVKASMWNISKSHAKEFRKYNITVNNILPGPTETNELKRLFLQLKSSGYENIIEDTLNQIPSGSFLSPKEIANAVIFLCSKYANHITCLLYTSEAETVYTGSRAYSTY